MNATRALRAAALLIDTTSPSWEAQYREPDVRLPLTDDERTRLRAIVRGNTASLALAREARGRPAARWGCQWRRPPFGTTWPDAGSLPDLVSLLRDASLLAHDDGDEALALARVRDLLGVARAMERVPSRTGHARARYAASIAAECLAEVVPDLDENWIRSAGAREPALDAIHDLLDEAPARAGLMLALRAQRVEILDIGQAWARGDIGLRDIFSTSAGPPPFQLNGYPFKALILRDVRWLLERHAELAEALSEETWPACQVKLPNGRGLNSRRYVATTLWQVPDHSSRDEYEARAERRMAAVALALKLFHAEHGHWPAAPSKLVGRYLPALPADPMARDGRPLGYIVRPRAAPVVYSVGRDGRDQAGASTQSDQWLWSNEDAVLPLDRRPRPPARLK